MTALYHAPHQFEPLLPSDAKQEALLSKAGDLVRTATALAGKRVPPELHALRFLFPRLWPEAEADASDSAL